MSNSTQVTFPASYPSNGIGQAGTDTRSDCRVELELLQGGRGVEIELRSKVLSLYGDRIRQEVMEVLNALEVKDAKVKIEDSGALPWTIFARVEAAARRALGARWERSPLNFAGYLPPFKSWALYPTQRERLRRSRLYLPGNEPRFFINAGLHHPDGIILDLEDSVHPSMKDEARILVRNALRAVNFYGAERMVRINQGERGLEDLEWVVPHNLHIVLIPKVESPEQVQVVEEKINLIWSQIPHEMVDEKGEKHPINPPLLMPIIESAKGALSAFAIATASPQVVALTLGLEDYTADIGAERTREEREAEWVRSQVVNAARAAGVTPIDTVFSDVSDQEGLFASVVSAKKMGFEGKGCIHPRQIAVIHRAFAPTPQEIERAKKIVEAWREAEEKGLGVVALGSKMIDPPVVRRAVRTLKLAGLYSSL